MERKEALNKSKNMMEELGLSDKIGFYPAQLSGGQQQRVSIARAVVGNPRLILADEPTGNLDSHHGEEVLDMLSTLNQQGTTILMATHSRTHAARAGRILTMLDGRLVSDTARVASP